MDLGGPRFDAPPSVVWLSWPAAGQAAVRGCAGRSPALGILGWRCSVVGAGGLAFGSADASGRETGDLWIPSLYMSY